MDTWSQEEKNFFIAKAQFRQENKLFKQGQWLDSSIEKEGVFCGCMHGSIMQTQDDVIDESAKAMKWPLWLSHLTEKAYEGLSAEESDLFPLDVIKSVPINTPFEDLNQARAGIEIDRLERLIVIQEKNDYKKKRDVIDVLNLCISLWKNPSTNGDDWSAAWSAAESAAKLAARSLAWSAARSAWSAALSAESAWSAECLVADSAAWSADSAAWSADSAARSAWSAELSAESAWSAADSAAWSAESASWSAESASWSAGSAALSAESAWSAEKASIIKHLSAMEDQ